MTMTTKFLLTILALLISAGAFSQSVGINSDGSTPDKSAILDISSVNQGLLIPRVTLTGVNDAATIASPATSLLVYNLTSGSGLIPGIYYNTGTTVAPVWARLTDSLAQGLTPALKVAVISVSVPYTGATGPVDLGAYDLTVNQLTVGKGGGAQGKNTAIGVSTLGSNTTGSNNTAIGNISLQTNITGNDLTALGSGADVSADGLTNSTAIGSGARVTASNAIQLGNTLVSNVNTSGTLTAGAVTYPNTDGTSGQLLTANADGSPTWQNAASVNLATGVNGTLPVLNGGTGATTFNGLVKGNGTSAMTAATAGTDYVVPSGDITGTAANVTGTVAIANGGTNSAAIPTNGGVGYGTGTAHAFTTAGTTGQVLTSNGSGAPSWQTASAGTVNLTSGATGTLPVLNGGTGVATSTGTGNVVLSTSPTLVTPALGTPTALVGTNITGTAAGLTAGNVTTNANLTGDVTSAGNATTLSSTAVIPATYGSATSVPVFSVDAKGRVTGVTNTIITGASPTGSALVSGKIILGNGSGIAAAVTPAGDVTINNAGVTAIGAGKVTSAMLAGSIDLATKVVGTLPVAYGGTGASSATGTGNVVLATSPTLVTPALGVPSVLIGTNITGTAAGLSIGGNKAGICFPHRR